MRPKPWGFIIQYWPAETYQSHQELFKVGMTSEKFLLVPVEQRYAQGVVDPALTNYGDVSGML